MIYPRPLDILQTIDATIAAKVTPSLSDLSGRSAIATIRHLLRLVGTQIELGGQILADDIVRLQTLLTEVESFFASCGAAHDGDNQAQTIKSTLARSQTNSDRYQSADVLAEEAAVLRECLYQALKHLQSLRDKLGDDASYRAIRSSIRDYIVWQVSEEGKLIAPAFYGQGPRR